jgi:hypothetical protein
MSVLRSFQAIISFQILGRIIMIKNLWVVFALGFLLLPTDSVFANGSDEENERVLGRKRLRQDQEENRQAAFPAPAAAAPAPVQIPAAAQAPEIEPIADLGRADLYCSLGRAEVKIENFRVALEFEHEVAKSFYSSQTFFTDVFNGKRWKEESLARLVQISSELCGSYELFKRFIAIMEEDAPEVFEYDAKTPKSRLELYENWIERARKSILEGHPFEFFSRRLLERVAEKVRRDAAHQDKVRIAQRHVIGVIRGFPDRMAPRAQPPYPAPLHPAQPYQGAPAPQYLYPPALQYAPMPQPHQHPYPYQYPQPYPVQPVPQMDRYYAPRALPELFAPPGDYIHFQPGGYQHQPVVPPAVIARPDFSRTGFQLEFNKRIHNPFLNSVQDPTLLEEVAQYREIKYHLDRLKPRMKPEVAQLAEQHVRDVQMIRLQRILIYKAVNDMIQRDEFKIHQFSPETLIHFENGYLTSAGFYQGYVNPQTLKHDFDGAKADERLASYHRTFVDTFQVAKELGDEEMILFFSSFQQFPCMDGRTSVIQNYRQELEVRRDLRKEETSEAGFTQDKALVLESKFMEFIRAGIDSQDEMIHRLTQNLGNRNAKDGLISSEDIQTYVVAKWKELGI